MVPPEIISALREKGFETPTPIQQRTILPSISKRADIVGAAETVRIILNSLLYLTLNSTIFVQ